MDPTEYVSLIPHQNTETDPVSETLLFSLLRIPDDGQSPETQTFLTFRTVGKRYADTASERERERNAAKLRTAPLC
jgi:hypothetical protein